MVHRIVYEAFVGPIPKGLEINHKNGKHHDNRIDNLEAITHAANNLHRYRVLGFKGRPGEQHHNAKLTDNRVIEMRQCRVNGLSYREIGTLFGVNGETARDAIRGITWNHIPNPVRVSGNRNAKLNEAQVQQMRSLHQQGFSCKDIAQMFGISNPNVSRITRRITWRHI